MTDHLADASFTQHGYEGIALADSMVMPRVYAFHLRDETLPVSECMSVLRVDGLGRNDYLKYLGMLNEHIVKQQKCGYHVACPSYPSMCIQC